MLGGGGGIQIFRKKTGNFSYLFVKLTYDHFIFVSKAYIYKFTPIEPFFGKKFLWFRRWWKVMMKGKPKSSLNLG